MLILAPVTTPSPVPPPPGQVFSIEETRVLELLREKTYDQVRQETGWSRGRIYGLAIRAGSRKTENRIRERQEERKKRQIDFLNEIINTTTKSDVLDFLDGIPDDSVQLFLTSCPYNLGKPYGNCPGADRLRFTYYHGFLMQVISEMARTLAPGGTVCLNLGNTRDWQDQILPLDVLLFDSFVRSHLTFQSRIIWTIPHGLTPKRRLAERYETILVFSKGEQQTFNPSAARIPQKDPGKRAFKGPRRGQLSGHPLGAHPTNVWNIPHVGHNSRDLKYTSTKHPAPFPLSLARRAILLYTMPGDLVADPFCGSGTTNHAGLETGRSFIGADLFYESDRASRLAKVIPDSISILPGVSDESIAVWQAEARTVQNAAVPITTEAEHRLIQQTFFPSEA
jgi:DNA modification methylase